MLFKNLLLALSAVVSAQNTPSLQQALSSNPDLSQLAGLVGTQPDLLSGLAAATNVTLLAPNNAAIGALLNSSAGQQLASQPGAIAALLQYHVINGTFYSSAINNTARFYRTYLTNSSYTNVTNGQRIQVVKSNNTVSVISGLLQNSTVVTADQNFTGGTIHVINSVLTLPRSVNTTLINAPNLSAAWGALNATRLLAPVNALRDVTIFAPNNAAFSAIGSLLANASMDTLMSVLRYHVVNGSRPLYSTTITGNNSVQSLQGTNITVTTSNNGTIYVNNAKVLIPDVLIAGGVVHVIDQVLNPGNTTTAQGPAFSGASSVTNVPFTSGVPSATVTVGGGAAGATGTSRSSTAAAAAMNTGAAGFGAAAVMGVVGAALLI